MQIDMDVKLNTDFHKWLNVASSFLLYLFVDSVLLSFQGGDNELAWYINEKDTCLRILEYLNYFFSTILWILSSIALLTWILYFGGDNVFLRQ